MGKILAAFTLAAVLGLAGTARADYAFSGSGSGSGSYGTLAGPDEIWTFNADAGESSFQNNDFGSPGVTLGLANYDEPLDAYGFVINFTGGGTIDLGSITTGNNSNCAGDSAGGTTFCTDTADIWYAFSTGPSSIDFLAQNDTFDETTGAGYFVNIFFDGALPTSFTGAWLTRFTPTPPGGGTAVPEPGSLALLGGGLAALVGLGAWTRRRRRRAVVRR